MPISLVLRLVIVMVQRMHYIPALWNVLCCFMYLIPKECVTLFSEIFTPSKLSPVFNMRLMYIMLSVLLLKLCIYLKILFYLTNQSNRVPYHLTITLHSVYRFFFPIKSILLSLALLSFLFVCFFFPLLVLFWIFSLKLLIVLYFEILWWNSETCAY